MSTKRVPVYRFEGRCLPPGKNVSERALHHNDFTEKQMRRIGIAGLPINYLHTSEQAAKRQGARGFEIGRVEESWLDDEGWLVARGYIRTDTLSGRAAALQVEKGLTSGLSLTHEVQVEPRITGDRGWFESKRFTDLTICPPDLVEPTRAGCGVSRGEYTEIEEERRSITEAAGSTPTTTGPEPSHAAQMDPKMQAQLELELKQAREQNEKLATQNKKLAENLKEFDVAANQQEQAFQAQLKEREDREAFLKNQLDGFFQARDSQVAAKQQEVANMTSDPTNAKTAFDEIRALAQNPTQLDAVDRVFTLVAENMRAPTRASDESDLQRYKSRLASGANEDVQGLIDHNRKRFRGNPGGEGGGSSAMVAATQRELAILRAVQADIVNGLQ